MSYYDPQSWQVPMKEASWEQLPPSSRSEAGSTTSRQDTGVFNTQIEEVDRALDNLAQSGKLFNAPSRRDSVPVMGGSSSFADFSTYCVFSTPASAKRHPAPRMSQRHSIGDYDQMRSGSNLQNFYSNQRHQPRPNEAEQMMQAKRRMAAQRERELRNYHQEQQYNRSELSIPFHQCTLNFSDAATDASAQVKPDRAISPNTTNEEDRRELIARQHRALYGNEPAPFQIGGSYGEESHTPRPSKPTSGNTSAVNGRGPSPRTYDGFVMGQNQAPPHIVDGGAQLMYNEQKQQSGKGPSPNPQQQRSRADSTSSPASNPPSQTFSLFDSTAQQSSRTSTSSPGGSPPRQAKTSAAGPAPIGTRPIQNQAANPVFNKQSSTPSPSPLGFGFAPSDSLHAGSSGNERSTSAASNPAGGAKDSSMGSWGTGSGVWGNNKPLGVQASVWG